MGTRADTPIPANDTGEPALSDAEEAHMTGENVAMATPSCALTVFPTEPVEPGKGGEGCVL
jgi:hypothetical protein